MPPRIPTLDDFRPIFSSHPASSSPAASPPVALIPPNPPESTTAFLLLLHGLGDTHAPFARFARNLALPGTFAIALRGVAPLPAAFLFADDDDAAGGSGGGGGEGYHWGDDLLATADGAIDASPRADPGYERARAWVLDKVVAEVLVGRCGWDVADVMLFGFGQGGSVALGLASSVRMGLSRVEEVKEEDEEEERGGKEDGAGKPGRQQQRQQQQRQQQQQKAFKGVVSVGGSLPPSMVPSLSGRGKARTPVLVLCGRESEAVDEDAVELLEQEFDSVQVVRWKRADDGMPQNRDEALPMMRFFAERLRNVWL
ncbi:hypothetical protein VTJ83DRAFT_5642 [Remersonia thermophila]|uniref:Phospholipase/carboxylesterase/thioesterase domain-containing protein n=1 Tax=Remersonia thermophila TaxID=72144 RepID=A0ABR4D7D5_9PEZI